MPPAVHTESPQRADPALRRDAAQRQAQASWQRGAALQQAGRLAEARDCFADATRAAPEHAAYWLLLALTEQMLGHADLALAGAQQAFDRDRGNPMACQMVAEFKLDARRWDEALAALDGLAAPAGRDARWHLLRGQALLSLSRSEAAIVDLSSALRLEAGDPPARSLALTLLGHAHAKLKQPEQAGKYYRIAAAADPGDPTLAGYAAHYSAWACDWTSLQEDLPRLDRCIDALRHAAPADAAAQLPLFAVLGLSDDPQLLKCLAERHFAPPAGAARPPRRSAPVPRPGGKLRIGLISSDFHHHATSMLLVEVLEAIDVARFECYFYSGGPDDGSAMRERVRATAARVHEVAQWSDDELAEQVRRDRIGVLIDLKGFTRGSRLRSMAARPAPLQLAWLGFPGSCGADFVDYIIGDPVVTPLHAQPHFTECIAQMPHCYQPNDSRRSRPPPWSRAECGLPERGVVLASFNQSYKILPPVFEAWCRILVAAPQSVLWLLVPGTDAQQRLRQVAAGHGVAAERLIFAPFVDIEAHRARLPNADLVLDTYPCGGHTTASDALWAGVPVLTMIGQSFASRVAASLVTTLGLPELVCADLGEYITKAGRHANDPAALRRLRDGVEAGRGRSPLFDGRRFARDFERLLLRMVERQDAGLAPAALVATTPAEDRRNASGCGDSAD